MKKNSSILLLILCAAVMLIAINCKSKKNVSTVTGWQYNSSLNDNFSVEDQEYTIPTDLVLIKGGTFTSNILYKPKQITVSSFLIGKHEETNHQYKSYLNFLKIHQPQFYKTALPDTTDIFITEYFNNEVYDYCPVVGLCTKQIEAYCAWKTNRVNELILLKEGVINKEDVLKEPLVTEAYLSGISSISIGNLEGEGKRNVRMEDGVLIPQYRIPSALELEWALSNIYEQDSSKSRENKITVLKNCEDLYGNASFFPTIKEAKKSLKFEKFNLENIYSAKPNDKGIYKSNSLLMEFCTNSVDREKHYNAAKVSDENKIELEIIDNAKPQKNIGFRCAMVLVGSPVGW